MLWPSMQNDLDTHIIYMTKKIHCYDNYLLVGEDDDDFFLQSLLQYSISFTDSATAAAIGNG